MTTDASFNEKGSTSVIYVDYANICKVVSVESRVYVDDGLISLIVKEIGNFATWYYATAYTIFTFCIQEAIT